MKFRMSRTLALLKFSRAAARAGRCSGGGPCARLLAQRLDRAASAAIASMRSRIVRSSSAALAAARRLVRVHLDRLPVLEQRGVELILLFELAGAADVLCAALCIARSSAILYSGLSGLSWTARGEVRDRGVPVAGPRGFLALAERPPGRAPGPGHRCRENRTRTPASASSHPLLFHTFLPAGGQRGASPAVEVLDDHRFPADLHEPIPAVDRAAFPRLRLPASRRTIREHRDPAAIRQIEHADELHRDRRRRWRWRRARPARGGTIGAGGLADRRRWRRGRRRLEPEGIPLAPPLPPAARPRATSRWTSSCAGSTGPPLPPARRLVPARGRARGSRIRRRRAPALAEPISFITTHAAIVSPSSASSSGLGRFDGARPAQLPCSWPGSRSRPAPAR